MGLFLMDNIQARIEEWLEKGGSGTVEGTLAVETDILASPVVG
jgi:hypothetical protein